MHCHTIPPVWPSADPLHCLCPLHLPTQEDRSSVPQDIAAYIDKLDRDEDDAEEVLMCVCACVRVCMRVCVCTKRVVICLSELILS